MNCPVALNSSELHTQTITNEFLVNSTLLGKKAGFLGEVSVTAYIVDGVFGADGKHSVDEYLFMFLQVCAAQLQIAFIDNTNWETARFVYPMPTFDGFFKPTEVLIKTQKGSADVVIMAASEETTQN